MYEVSKSWKWQDQFVGFDNTDFVGMAIVSTKLVGSKAFVGFMTFAELLNFVLKTGIQYPNYAYFRLVFESQTILITSSSRDKMVKVTADKMEKIRVEYDAMMQELENDESVPIEFSSNCSLQ